MLAFIIALVGCATGPNPPHVSPERAARDFVERMQHADGDPSEAHAAFELLSARARGNLVVRATRYGAASGKTIAAESMLVPARFTLRFAPQRYVAVPSDGRTLVEVFGLRAEDRASIPCVLEEGAWRVDLTLPSLVPLQMRPRGSLL